MVAGWVGGSIISYKWPRINRIWCSVRMICSNLSKSGRSRAEQSQLRGAESCICLWFYPVRNYKWLTEMMKQSLRSSSNIPADVVCKGTSGQPCILVQCDGHHLVVLKGARCQLKQEQYIHYPKTYQTVCRSARLHCRLAQRNFNTAPQVKFRVADMTLLSCAIFCSCGTFGGSSTACRTCKVVTLMAFKWLRSSNLRCTAFLCAM